MLKSNLAKHALMPGWISTLRVWLQHTLSWPRWSSTTIGHRRQKISWMLWITCATLAEFRTRRPHWRKRGIPSIQSTLDGEKSIRGSLFSSPMEFRRRMWTSLWKCLTQSRKWESASSLSDFQTKYAIIKKPFFSISIHVCIYIFLSSLKSSCFCYSVTFSKLSSSNG